LITCINFKPNAPVSEGIFQGLPLEMLFTIAEESFSATSSLYYTFHEQATFELLFSRKPLFLWG